MEAKDIHSPQMGKEMEVGKFFLTGKAIREQETLTSHLQEMLTE
jgi:hypothetical protein